MPLNRWELSQILRLMQGVVPPQVPRCLRGAVCGELRSQNDSILERFPRKMPPTPKPARTASAVDPGDLPGPKAVRPGFLTGILVVSKGRRPQRSPGAPATCQAAARTAFSKTKV